MKNKNNSRQKLNKGKDGRPRLITEKGHPSADTLLNPNCSEEVFRLTGSLKDIKKQMLNMAEWIEGEYTGTYGDGPIEKLSPQIKTSLNDLRKKIKAKSFKSLAHFMENYK